jgi:hypothetical protein
MTNKLNIIILFLLATPAMAGSNECEGRVTVGKEWTIIKGDTGDFAPDGCRFRTSSKLGHRILATCPDNSDCTVSIPLDLLPMNPNEHQSPIITRIDGVSRYASKSLIEKVTAALEQKYHGSKISDVSVMIIENKGGQVLFFYPPSHMSCHVAINPFMLSGCQEDWKEKN